MIVWYVFNTIEWNYYYWLECYFTTGMLHCQGVDLAKKCNVTVLKWWLKNGMRFGLKIKSNWIFNGVGQQAILKQSSVIILPLAVVPCSHRSKQTTRLTHAQNTHTLSIAKFAHRHLPNKSPVFWITIPMKLLEFLMWLWVSAFVRVFHIIMIWRRMVDSIFRLIIAQYCYYLHANDLNEWVFTCDIDTITEHCGLVRIRVICVRTYTVVSYVHVYIDLQFNLATYKSGCFSFNSRIYIYRFD